MAHERLAGRRLGLLANHYRGEWEWDEGLIDRATDRLGTWARSVVHLNKLTKLDDEEDGVLMSVRDRLDDDLDTPGALLLVDAAAREGRDVRAAAALIGVTL